MADAPKPVPKDATPTAAEAERMRQQKANAAQDKNNEKGATSGFTTRDRMKELAKGGKIKRYSGEDDSDVRTPEGEFKMSGLGDRTIAETNATEAGSAMPAEKPKGSVDFNQRFREEMKRFKDEGGDKSFEYNGKKYALEYAKPKAAAPAAPAKERFARAVTGITSYDSTRKDREAKQDRDMGIANEKAMAKDKGPNLPAYRAMKPLRRGDSMKTGGAIKKYASGGSIRGDGIAQRGKTKGRML
jgi:hypothetical protein